MTLDNNDKMVIRMSKMRKIYLCVSENAWWYFYSLHDIHI